MVSLTIFPIPTGHTGRCALLSVFVYLFRTRIYSEKLIEVRMILVVEHVVDTDAFDSLSW